MRQIFNAKPENHIIHCPADWYKRYDGTIMSGYEMKYYQLSDIRPLINPKLGRNRFIWFLKTIGLIGYDNKPSKYSQWFKYVKVALPKNLNWLNSNFFGKGNTFISQEGVYLIIKEYSRLRKEGANI